MMPVIRTSTFDYMILYSIAKSEVFKHEYIQFWSLPIMTLLNFRLKGPMISKSEFRKL